MMEKEFMQRELTHKITVVMAKAQKYYEDLQNTGANIPDFIQYEKTPKEKAYDYVVDIILKGLLNQKYELAWNEIAPFLD